MKFRKKPVVIGATQWFKNGDHPAVKPLPFGWAVIKVEGYPDYDADDLGIIETLEGHHQVSPGDWIITGVKGEHYPCKPDIFAVTYERLAEPVQEPVAWMQTENFVDADNLWAERISFNQEGNGTPLYTAPPQRKPLTDEKIEAAYRQIWRNLPDDFDHTSSAWIEQGVRYAEAAHGIGSE